MAVVAPAVAVAGTGRAPGMAGPSDGHSFGLVLNRFDWGLDPGRLAGRLTSIAQRAEAAGFRDLWMMDHFRQITPVGRGWEDLPEAYVALSYLAG